MFDYIHYLVDLRKIELDCVTVELHEDIVPKLKRFVNDIQAVEYKDGFMHCYYGDIKNILQGFSNYWVETMDAAAKLENKHTKSTDKKKLIAALENSITLAKHKHNNFEKDFGSHPNSSLAEGHACLSSSYEKYLQELKTMKAAAERLDKNFQAVALAEVYILNKTLIKTHRLLDLTYTTLGYLVGSCLHKLQLSLEELVNKNKVNMRELLQSAEMATNVLVQELYETNKEYMVVSRNNTNHSQAEADVMKAIEKIQDKIEGQTKGYTMSVLEQELKYWSDRLADFRKVAGNVTAVRAEIDNMDKQMKIYKSYKSTEYPGAKLCCWSRIGTTYVAHQKYLHAKYHEAIHALMTHFSVPGGNLIKFKNQLGTYVRSEYHNAIYTTDYDMKQFYAVCDGDLVESEEKKKMYYDENGSYILDDKGEKLYTTRIFRSNYKLDVDNTMVKVSKDCGHSEKLRKDCKKNFPMSHDSFDILPDIESIDIKGTLTPEVVEYLWTSLATVLSLALRDVAVEKPRNPIHYFAHRLLAHKYRSSGQELEQHAKTTKEYRDNIYKQRKDAEIAEAKLWQSRQVKRRLPEESDDSKDQAEAFVYAMMQASQGIVE